MKITVLFFAYLKEKAGTDRLLFDMEPGVTVHQLKIQIREQYEQLDDLIDQVIVSVNQEFAADTMMLTEDSEVAFFPPVSGGGGEVNLLSVTYDPINVNLVVSNITKKTTGGVAVFVGVVREITGSTVPIRTERLTYEAYEEMAHIKLVQVSGEIAKKWPKVEQVAIVQRLGKLDPGVPSIVVACAGSHRDQGIFAAARYGIDRVKEIVPIWKKEDRGNGEDWIVGDYFPEPGE